MGVNPKGWGCRDPQIFGWGVAGRVAMEVVGVAKLYFFMKARSQVVNFPEKMCA